MISFQTVSLGLSDSRRIIAAGEKKALELGLSYDIAIVDAGEALSSQVRMGGALLGSVDISINKAYTARAFNMTTEQLGKAAQPNQALSGIHATNHSRVVIFGGAVPVLDAGVVIGAGGASGASGEHDIHVALSAAAAYTAA